MVDLVFIAALARFVVVADRMLALVLDMDGTLVGESLGVPFARPHLDAFLEYAFREFGIVGLWTAALPAWFEHVERHVLTPALARVSRRLGIECRFDFAWTRAQCINSGIYGYDRDPVRWKPLGKLWCRSDDVFRHMTHHNTLIVDDTPSAFSCNTENGIAVRTYETEDEHDDELLALCEYLDTLIVAFAEKKSVLGISKRNWRPPS